MKKILFLICLQIVFSSILFKSYAQTYSPGIRIVSESKQIFKEEQMIKKIIDDLYFEKIDIIKDKVVAQIKTDIKSLTNQTTRAENIILSTRTYLTVVEKQGKPYLRYSINGNNINFHVTTPDIVAGVGLGKAFDPSIYLLYDVTADIPLIQGGTAESIKFINPVWNITFHHWSGTRLSDLSIRKEDLEFWVKFKLETSFFPVYVSLNDISRRLTDYVQSTFTNNVELLKEFEVDENRQLLAKADLEKSQLLFIHNYSQTGIVKRTSSDKAATVLEDRKTTPASPPTGKSAADVLKSPKSTSGNTRVGIPVRKNQ